MANQLPLHHDLHGRDVSEARHIRIREDAAVGVCIGRGVDVMPGEECHVPGPVAAHLVAIGRAEYVTTKPPADEEVQSPDPAVATPDPAVQTPNDPQPAATPGKGKPGKK